MDIEEDYNLSDLRLSSLSDGQDYFASKDKLKNNQSNQNNQTNYNN